MARRRATIDGSGLRELIESNLRDRSGFASNPRVEGKLTANHDGLFHDNYHFRANGQELILRLAKRFDPLRTVEESREFLSREAETLRRLATCSLAFTVPRLICTVVDDGGEIIGLIESFLRGMPLEKWGGLVDVSSRLEVIAEIAAEVHSLPVADFPHLPPCADSHSHVRMEFEKLPPSLFAEWQVAADARSWIVAHLDRRPATVLHGDLLPQNILWRPMGDRGVSVIDWEWARLGDPAFDLAIVTRGARKPLKESGGFQRLLETYNEMSGTELPGSAVRIHELLLNLNWLAESSQAEAAGTLQGHGPEHYAQGLAAMLRRLK